MTIQAIIADLIGPFRLADAAAQAAKLNVRDGLYIVFGRHRGFSRWPFWRDVGWIHHPIIRHRRNLRMRFVRTPLQYIGASKDLPARLRVCMHPQLFRLDSRRSSVWLCVPRSELDAGARAGNGLHRAVAAIEEILIFLLKPRLNADNVATPPKHDVLAWIRNESQGQSVWDGERGRNARRLPRMIRVEAGKRVLVTSASSHREQSLRISWTPKGKGRARSLSRWFERKFPNFFERLFGKPEPWQPLLPPS